jgi:TolB-like protein/Flp pilus assembly protein TadD
MTLQAGTRLGPYEILSPIGAGGMGEVYRAKDTKLGRDVAIKVLPEDVAQDRDRLARFEREARALAALNHPGIVTIFSVEESGETRFLAMELVEGESLDSTLASGALPLSRFFDIATPLAEALSAAHERGIVHRDLKPGNVMVTREGRVKVLDFGLARVESPDSKSNLTNTPTESRSNLTAEGKVFGTVAYMSPEQARGGKVDARSDVFSLGIVLYQMLTGQRPFEGESAVDLITSILRDRPPSVTDLRPDVPATLSRVLRRCLEKDPRDRYQTSRDVYNELRELKGEIASGALSRATSDSPRPSRATASGETRTAEGFWIAVLPFRYAGATAELAALADGLTEDVVTGLSRFSYLKVIARSSTARDTSESVDVRSAGKELGARYVLDGSLRQAGTKLRLAVQLVDAVSGAHLWAENYERAFAPEAVFDLQDDLVPRIVSTVADQYGALVHSMSESLRGRRAADYSPHEAVLRAFGYWERVTMEEHGEVREILEAAVARAPGHSDCLAALSLITGHEYVFGYNLKPDPLGRARAIAQRAVASAPTNHFAHCALAASMFFQKDFAAFRPAADRALALNPMDSSTAALLGTMLAYACDWDYGRGVVERAKQINPHHPGWYHYVSLTGAYQRRDYRGALAILLKINMPGYYWPHVLQAAIYGQLGERQRANAAVREMDALVPNFAARAREEFGKWYDAELTEHLLDGLRKAGLEIPEERESAAAPPETTASGETRTDEGFWVAVLPFRYSGPSADLTTLAEGLTEDVVTGLSRFSYLRVIARGSPTLRYTDKARDLRIVGKELGVRYVMEGYLRQAGAKLRLTVQLADAATGAHLWAENYERDLAPEAIFEVQDDLVPRIVSTVADMNGVLPRSMSAAVRGRSPEDLSPYEAVLRSFGYLERVTPEELEAARSALKIAVRKAPADADALAMLAFLCVQDHAQGFDLQPESLPKGLDAARRAVESGPSNPLAHFSLAQALFFQKELASFRLSAERAVALNPMDGNSIAFMGELLTYAGDRERGLALAERARQLNPNHPGWYWYPSFYDAYRRGDDRAALGFALRANLPGHWGWHLAMAAAHGQLGQNEEAARAVRGLLRVRPNVAGTLRGDLAKWFDPECVARLIDGLRKAGLEIAGEPRGSAAPPADAPSGETRTDEGFWVAVLPFQHGGAEAGLAALADGMTDEIVTGLSRFSYLRVISRTSTRRYSSGADDVRSVGKELGARYVLDGSLRQAGSAIRISVQLIDAVSGANLWAETYNRSYQPEAIFDVQDDVVRRIVSTVADTYGVLPHSMSEALRGKHPDELTPYEAVIRGLAQLIRVSADEHASVREGLERAVQEAPGNADCWALLSNMCREEYAHGFNVKPDPLGRALAAARRAVEIAPSNHLAHHALATALFLRRELSAFRSAAERAIALNPMDGFTMAFLGSLIAYSGDWERGCAMAKQAREMNPNHPSWYWFTDCFNAYRQGDDRAALDIARKIQMPEFWRANLALAVAYGQLGERESAERALQQLLTLRPNFAAEARAELLKWWTPDVVERLMDGLRKAGLPGGREEAIP